MSMNILVVDVGGTHVKLLASGQTEMRRIDSGRTMTAAQMVADVKKLAAGWTYDVVSIGYPGPVVHGAPVKEPANLGSGWVGFDYAAAFERPVRIINDAAMQALGSDQGGRMLFLGLGTGLGSAMVVDGRVEPLELAHLPYKDKQTYEDVIGMRGLEKLGKKRWRREVGLIIAQLAAALEPDYVVLGGGNARFCTELPGNVRLGQNANAFVGGFRLWAASQAAPAAPPVARGERRIVDTREALFEAAAAEFYLQAITAVGNTGRFCVALSGGSTPLGMYSLLANDPKWRSLVPWERVHVFWGDERHVPPDDAESNFGAAQRALLSSVPVPEANVHRVRAELADAAQAAAEYETELRDADCFHLAPGELPRFDLILLGLGPEGHTASLFPGTRALAETQHTVVANWVGKLNTDRITFTAPVINNAAAVLFLVAGDDKATIVKAILEGPHEPDQLPAQLIQPINGRLIWLMDRSAAHLVAPSAAASAGANEPT